MAQEGAAVPFTPIILVCHDLHYYVPGELGHTSLGQRSPHMVCGEEQHAGQAALPCRPPCARYAAVPLRRADPSGGELPGVVKESDDKEIAGKLELLKGEGRTRPAAWCGVR